MPEVRGSCWNPRFIATALGAAILIVVVALIARQYPRGSAVRIALAVVQGLATACVILMPWWTMRRLDELQQRVQLEALAIAFFGTGVLGAGYGFLEGAGLPHLDWGLWIWPGMAFLWAAGTAIASRRYK